MEQSVWYSDSPVVVFGRGNLGELCQVYMKGSYHQEHMEGLHVVDLSVVIRCISPKATFLRWCSCVTKMFEDKNMTGLLTSAVRKK